MQFKVEAGEVATIRVRLDRRAIEYPMSCRRASECQRNLYYNPETQGAKSKPPSRNT